MADTTFENGIKLKSVFQSPLFMGILAGALGTGYGTGVQVGGSGRQGVPDVVELRLKTVENTVQSHGLEMKGMKDLMASLFTEVSTVKTTVSYVADSMREIKELLKRSP